MSADRKVDDCGFGEGYGFWRLMWHRFLGHDLTHTDEEFYPPAVCRTCELVKLKKQGDSYYTNKENER